MKLSTAQIQNVIDGAPEGATHVDDDGGYWNLTENQNVPSTIWTHKSWRRCSTDGFGYRQLSDLREILALRTELEAEKRRADELAAHVESLKDAILSIGSTATLGEAENELTKAESLTLKTPTQSLAALKLEQYKKGFAHGYGKGYDIFALGDPEKPANEDDLMRIAEETFHNQANDWKNK